MQAFADGKEIEYTSIRDTDWMQASTPLWNWYKFDYRIKPEHKEPITLLECIKAPTDLGRYSSEWLTQEQYDATRPGVYIKVLRTITI